MGKSTISMAIFNSYVQLPEGNMISVFTESQEFDVHDGRVGPTKPWSNSPTF